MARYDRYVLSQLLVLFGFYALVFAAVFWIKIGLALFDQLIGDGQSPRAVLTYALLSLPEVIARSLPLAALVASAQVAHRLNGESELIPVFSGGASPWRLIRPVAVFALVLALGAAWLSHSVLPAARAALAERERALSGDVVSRMLRDGAFLHPAPGITVFIREIDESGALNDLFLSDRRAKDHAETYSAGRAIILGIDAQNAEGTAPRLVMFDGVAQTLDTDTGRIVTTRFDELSFDLNRLRSALNVTTRAEQLSTRTLWSAPGLVALEGGISLGVVTEHLHSRFRDPLIVLAVALFGFVLLGGQSRSRRGFVIRVGALVTFAVLLKSLDTAGAAIVHRQASAWPLGYLPVAVALCAPLLILFAATRGRRVAEAAA